MKSATAKSGPPKRAKKATPVPFSRSLVLHQWLLGLFGLGNLDELAKGLHDVDGLDENNVTRFYAVLAARFPALTALPLALLQEFDNNIVAHTQAINAGRVARGESISWKYFQYLSLLFTEIYLHFYFKDPAQLRSELNIKIAAHNAQRQDGGSVELFDPAGEPRTQLNKLAFWNATGSGKTLLMHVNQRQYVHHLTQAGRASSLNRIILLTPNEGLSRQHLGEFAESGISAEIFDKDEATLFRGSTVDVIEITKLSETMGDKTVAVGAFEGSNLVMVDEGHRGASSGKGGSWMDRRNALCRDGFSFEYSATFGQAVKGDSELSGTYSRSILFDYSYRWFYADGFGKDYQILNLDAGTQATHQHTYLTACLMSFYQQVRLFELEHSSFVPFRIDKPLWVFVGGSVNAVKSVGGRPTSDVLEVLEFLRRFVANRSESEATIHSVLHDGLVGANGKDIFAGRFRYLTSHPMSRAQIFDDILSRVFNSPSAGSLHVENLRGVEGEIGLRVGDNDYFGVINVGDADKLVSLCEEHTELNVATRDFTESLFARLDKDSSVNLLIGSRKFTEGWNSHRVSTMALLNIGKSEGSQIIQLFGRGVRLRGHSGSLKRSSRLNLALEAPVHVGVLETLGVFGVHADYMATFRDFLEEEGLPSDDPEEVLLPVRSNLDDQKLITLQLQDEVDGQTTKFGLAFRNKAPVVTIKPPDDIADERLRRGLNKSVAVNWYPKVQSRRSAGVGTADDDQGRHSEPFSGSHLALLDYDALYLDLQRYKAERGWHNLNLTRNAIPQLLGDSTWYTLEVPAYVMAFGAFDNVRQWQQIAAALLRGYVDRYYRLCKSAFELPLLEYQRLMPSDRNLLGASKDIDDGYHYRVRTEDGPTAIKLRDLADRIRDGKPTVFDDLSFKGVKVLGASSHLYEPLLAADGAVAVIQPIALDDHEARFVRELRTVASTDLLLDGWELRFLRNRSRSGVGFFEGGNFYPDFLIWLTRDDVQHLVFVDPKGMRNLGGTHHAKVEFHREIKAVQARLAATEPSVQLHSFLISVTTELDLTDFWKKTKAELVASGIVFQDDPDHIGQIIRAVLA